VLPIVAAFVTAQ